MPCWILSCPRREGTSAPRKTALHLSRILRHVLIARSGINQPSPLNRQRVSTGNKTPSSPRGSFDRLVMRNCCWVYKYIFRRVHEAGRQRGVKPFAFISLQNGPSLRKTSASLSAKQRRALGNNGQTENKRWHNLYLRSTRDKKKKQGCQRTQGIGACDVFSGAGGLLQPTPCKAAHPLLPSDNSQVHV